MEPSFSGAVYTLFRQNRIPMIIMKGTAVVFYPNLAQRTMGDVDFLVPAEYYDKAKEMLITNGYTVRDDSKYSRHIDVEKTRSA